MEYFAIFHPLGANKAATVPNRLKLPVQARFSSDHRGFDRR
jgi:hypothetical protein